MRIGFVPAMKDTESALTYLENPALVGVPNCNVPWTQFYLFYNGDIAPCVTYYIDNIRNLGYDVRRVLGHPRYRDFLAFHRKQMPFAAACAGCCSAWMHERKPE